MYSIKYNKSAYCRILYLVAHRSAPVQRQGLLYLGKQLGDQELERSVQHQSRSGFPVVRRDVDDGAPEKVVVQFRGGDQQGTGKALGKLRHGFSDNAKPNLRKKTRESKPFFLRGGFFDFNVVLATFPRGNINFATV